MHDVCRLCTCTLQEPAGTRTIRRQSSDKDVCAHATGTLIDERCAGDGGGMDINKTAVRPQKIWQLASPQHSRRSNPSSLN